MHPKTNTVIIILILLIVAGFFYFFGFRNTGNVNESPAIVTEEIEYANETYGFEVDLPKTWEGYTVVESKWEGYSLSANGNAQVPYGTGPLISVRHPAWTESAPRQDIPIMVFTVVEWNDLVSDKFHIGAAPINPSELTRNETYVFALPARYNFSYYTGYEEVESILQSGAVKAF